MKASKYVQMPAEAVFKLRKAFKTACCDCGLVHSWELSETEDGFVLTVKRDNRATAQMRLVMKRASKCPR